MWYVVDWWNARVGFQRPGERNLLHLTAAGISRHHWIYTNACFQSTAFEALQCFSRSRVKLWWRRLLCGPLARYHLWRCDWLKLLGWLTARNALLCGKPAVDGFAGKYLLNESQWLQKTSEMFCRFLCVTHMLVLSEIEVINFWFQLYIREILMVSLMISKIGSILLSQERKWLTGNIEANVAWRL